MSTAREMCLKAQPTVSHQVLARSGIPIITQNVDGLHQRAGSINVLEPHGNLFTGVVLYGENLKVELTTMIDMVTKATHLLVIGTSLNSLPVGSLPDIARAKDIDVLTINKDTDKEVPKILGELGLLSY